MGDVETDLAGLLEDWRGGRAGTRELYAALRKPMYHAARQGLISITSRPGDPQDVEDAVYAAFLELEAKGPEGVKSSLLGLAKRIAFRRGQDKGRAVLRRREKMKEAISDLAILDEKEIGEDEIVAAARQERLFEWAVDCLDELTAEQRDVVTVTVMGHETLSDWALRNGKSHQSASRQRLRALQTLRRCVDARGGPRVRW